jgi:hypothetical protein
MGTDHNKSLAIKEIAVYLMTKTLLRLKKHGHILSAKNSVRYLRKKGFIASKICSPKMQPRPIFAFKNRYINNSVNTLSWSVPGPARSRSGL